MSQTKSQPKWAEFIIAGFGLLGLLAAQWVLTSAIPGTQYSQGDGKMAQAVINTALKFGGLFHLNNINPLQGMGSQLQPDNVWANPAYWPFAVVDSPLALDISALVALGCLAIACYLMARCFDLPVLPSIVGAQLNIVLFGPLAYMLVFYQVFWINPGLAVVYAPLLLALGIVGRLERSRPKDSIFAGVSIFALLLWGLSCDPLWVMVTGISLFGAFAVVAVSPLRLRPILVRVGALACCLALLLISGVIEYVYTLSQYSTRVWFSEELAYVPQAFMASIVLISPKTAGGYYGICALGWLLGIAWASGRVRVLVIAGLTSFAILAAYSVTFLLARKWWLPLPLYVEHSLFPLFTMAAIAGYWAALSANKQSIYLALTTMRSEVASVMGMKSAPQLSLRPLPGISTALTAWLPALLIAASIPMAATIYAHRAGPKAPKFHEPFPNEPEFVRHLGDAIGLRVGGTFRGSLTFVQGNITMEALSNLWMRGIPTLNEYSQLVTPQALYLNASLFKHDIGLGELNHYVPWISAKGSYDVLFKTLQAFGVRYFAQYVPGAPFPVVVVPRRPAGGKPGEWFIYELPNPNLGHYNPIEVATAGSGAKMIAVMSAPQFDFTKQVVLSTPLGETLVPARNMRLSLIRGGLHVSGASVGTSLVVLPQQFSHCLRARDPRIRLVRANLLMTGLLFSGNVDSDILFDYGIFTPGCRRMDIADLKQIIDLPVPPRHPFFVDRDVALARLRDAGVAIRLLRPAPPPGAARR